jgi:hypothetical protein
MDCPICLGEYINKCTIDSCSHSFCESCITAWSLKSNSCPCCRSEFGMIIDDTNIVKKIVPRINLAYSAVIECHHRLIKKGKKYHYRCLWYRFRTFIDNEGLLLYFICDIGILPKWQSRLIDQERLYFPYKPGALFSILNVLFIQL